MPKFAKDHNSGKIWWCFFKSWPSNLLIIPYQLTKFQASSSNSFQNIMLTSLKFPNFQRAITLEEFDGIHSKDNQIMYSSFPISWPSFKFLVQILSRNLAEKSLKCPNLQRAITPQKNWHLFFKSYLYSFWDKLTSLKCPNLQRAITAEKFDGFFFQKLSGNLLIIPYQLTKLQESSSNTLGDILLTRFHSDFFKSYPVTYSSSPISWASFKILRGILLTSLKYTNIQRAITPEKNDGIHSKVNQAIYSSSPISWPKFQDSSSNTFRDILLTRFHSDFFWRGITPEREKTQIRKKYGSAIFSWGIHILNFRTLVCTVHKIRHASKSMTDTHTESHTSQKQYVPSTS